MEKDEDYSAVLVEGCEPDHSSSLNKYDTDSYLESCIKDVVIPTIVRSVGINDSPFKLHCMVGGKRAYHSAYRAWANMLSRCYNPGYQKKYPAYIGCSVCHECLIFSNFLSWWRLNNVKGWQLDKDLLMLGNKVYCPELCIFIPKDLNTFHLSRDADRGDYLIGACYVKKSGKFTSSLTRNGKLHYLGSFLTEHEAHAAWFERKMQIAISYRGLCDSIHPELFNGLINKITSMRNS